MKPRSEHERTIRACYQRALTRLRQSHDEEFSLFLGEEYEKAGVTIRRRASRMSKTKEKAAHE